jgi:hypothetical protein
MSEGESKTSGPKINAWSAATLAIVTAVLGLIAGLATYKKAIDLSTDLIAEVAKTKEQVEGLKVTYEKVKKEKDEIDSKYDEIKKWIDRTGPRMKELDPDKVKAMLDAADARSKTIEKWIDRVGPRAKELDPDKVKAVLDAVATSDPKGRSIAEAATRLTQTILCADDPRTGTAVSIKARSLSLFTPDDNSWLSFVALEKGGVLVVSQGAVTIIPGKDGKVGIMGSLFGLKTINAVEGYLVNGKEIVLPQK